MALTEQKQNQSGIMTQFEVSVLYLVFIHFYVSDLSFINGLSLV